MITESTDRHVQSSVKGRTIAMKLDPTSAGAAKIMNILVNLYTDQETALLREYGANALDAHVAAGNTAPIEITIPTNNMMEPVLVVKDYGIGLSEFDIEAIYSQYGNSTKDDSNDFTGAFGLGCKSALTYCDMFTLISTKDEVEVTVAVTRDDFGGGSMTIVDTRVVKGQVNGTEVRIPVDVPNNFMEKAHRLFRFWKPGTVLVNGEEIPAIEGLKLSDQMMLVDDALLYPDDYIVMGALPYPTRKLNLGLSHGLNLVVEVPLGVFEPVPSREGLIDTTQDFIEGIEAIRESFDALMVQAIQRDIDDAEDHAAALEIMLRWHQKVPERLKPTDGYTYKGDKLPLRMESKEDGNGGRVEWLKVPGNRSKLADHSKVTSYAATQWAQTWWIHGFDREKWTPTMRKKLEHYMLEEHNLSEYGLYSYMFLVTPSRIRSPFIRADRRIPWSAIQSVKLPRNRGGATGDSTRIPGSYDMIVGGTYEYGVPADDIDQSNPIYYVVSGSMGSYEKEAILAAEPDATFVMMTSNRVDKFLRNFPDAKKPRSRASELAEEAVKVIDHEQMKILSYHALYHSDVYGKLDPDLFDDPDVQDCILYCSEDKPEDLEERITRANYFRPYGKEITVPKVEDPFKKYKLLSENRYSTPFLSGKSEHAVVYMNAMYPILKAQAEMEALHEEALAMDLARTVEAAHAEALIIDAERDAAKLFI
jgi:hypothetical protein